MSHDHRPAGTRSLAGCGLLVQMTGLAAVMVLALVLLVEQNMTFALIALGVLLVAGTIAAAWCAMRFLVFEEEGDPPFLPARRRRPAASERRERPAPRLHPRPAPLGDRQHTA